MAAFLALHPEEANLQELAVLCVCMSVRTEWTVKMKLKQLKQSFNLWIYPRAARGNRRIMADDDRSREELQFEHGYFQCRRPKRLAERKLHDFDFAYYRHQRSVCRLSWKDRSKVKRQWQRHYEKDSWGPRGLWIYKYRKMITGILSANHGEAIIRLSGRDYVLEHLLGKMELLGVWSVEYLPSRLNSPSEYAFVRRYESER